MIAARARNAIPANERLAQFHIGRISVTVSSDLDEAFEDFVALYSGCRIERPPAERTIHMEVRACRRMPVHRFDIVGDGEKLFNNRRRNEVLPYLEWGVNWRVIATRTEFVQLHSATLARKGQAIVFAGPSGTGKSTLAAALLRRGWNYLSDEFALIDPATLHVHPFPKALCIKAGSFDLVERLGLPIWRRRHYVKALKGRVGYIRMGEFAAQVQISPVPVRLVVFPQYAEGETPRLYPVSRGRAAFSLAGYALNRRQFGDQTLPVLGDLVRRADCYGLTSAALEGTCDLVESLL